MTRVYPVRYTEPGDDPLRFCFRVYGLVQGVGFRPFVFRMAEQLGLSGCVRNTVGGVEIEAEGSAVQVQRLLTLLEDNPPPVAEIQRIESFRIEPTGESGFRIVKSVLSGDETALVSPDVGTCDNCLREMRDPGDRRHRYPFINCTNCGPRFTIVEGVPYDRGRTTMRDFELCPACAKEYGDVSDRRFHAEPVACPDCGPRVKLLDPKGHTVATGEDALEMAREQLEGGDVVAVKGLGGFHLACDATNEDAVTRLRERKGRPDRPLAVMCRDLDTVERYCCVTDAEKRILESPRRPVLLVRRRSSPGNGLKAVTASVAPGISDIGVMLPYTPLHHLLFEADKLPCLVMTSGNRSGEPIVCDNGEAVTRLGNIADALLVHDRPVWNRCDDSVGFADGHNLVLMRRSRGFVPLPVQLNRKVEPTLALGAETSNVFALAAGRRVFLSQHIGDVDNLDTLAFLRESIQKFCRWLGIEPAVVAHDLHPDLLTTRLAYELAEGCRRVAVQHHHAHFLSALAAAGVDTEAQGLVLDGTGWGPDRTVWGGELLVGSAGRIRRAGHLRLLPLPGGDAAIRRPLRQAIACLHVLAPDAADAPLDIWSCVSSEEISAVRRMIDRGFNTPLTSSAGRLFDAVAALLGVREKITYEGQAAIELEQLASRGTRGRGPAFRLEKKEEDDKIVLDPAPLVSGLVDALLDKKDRADLALAFHVALAESLAGACARVRDGGGPEKVVLCGGVFQNRILTRLTRQALTAAGLVPVPPGLIPVNDGGLALGQVLAANTICVKPEE